MYSLENRNAIITGASRGLGLAIAKAYVKAGASVLLCSRDADALEKARQEVLPHFKQYRYGKIVQLSGGGATSPLPRATSYAASKAAVVRFMETVAEEVREDHIDVNALAPGLLNTRLLDDIIAAGPEKAGEAAYHQALKGKNEGGMPLEKGADLAVFLGSAESDGISGKLISAIWDDWATFPKHMKDMTGTDIFTLRRITLNDRGLKWCQE
jgi:NAD(P)-dependent dehydrogenase (short-subunit alcohol dehydrogenase family)